MIDSKIMSISLYSTHREKLKKAKISFNILSLRFNLSEFIRFCLEKESLIKEFKESKINNKRW